MDASAADPRAAYRDPRAGALRERFARLFGGEELPVPVERIAEDLLGLRVETAELPVSGMLVPAERRILLNRPEFPPRRRFTLAHELGHWVCQCRGRPVVEPIYCRADDVGDERADGARLREREANIFAAELLMPEQLVRRELARGAELPALAERFGVSRPAMHWRLFSFGLVEAGPAPAPSDAG